MEGIAPMEIEPLVLQGNVLDVLRTLPDGTFQTSITSPPFWMLRRYDICSCSLPKREGNHLLVEPVEKACEWCGGTGKVKGMEEQIWGGRKDCTHQWVDCETSGSGYDFSTGKSCSICRAWIGHLGCEPTPGLFLEHMMEIFNEVKRVLRDDGVCWIEIGDVYIEKRLALIPERLALALHESGWIVRQDLIWARDDPMIETVYDRFARAHSYIFMLTKRPRYFFDITPIREKAVIDAHIRNVPKKLMFPNLGVRSNESFYSSVGMRGAMDGKRNPRSVWRINRQSIGGVHFAIFPEAIPERCILSATSEYGACPECGAPWRRLLQKKMVTEVSGAFIRETVGWAPTCSCYPNPCDKCGKPWKVVGENVSTPGCSCRRSVPCLVLDPFAGSGTTLLVAKRLGRRSVGIELNPMYVSLMGKRLREAPIETVFHPGQRKLSEFSSGETAQELMAEAEPRTK